MNILLGCLFIAMLLPFIAKIPLALAMHKESQYDNKHPRAQQARLTGFGARALAAHQNAFESLIIFGAAIATTIAVGQTGELIQTLAITHIVARIAYNILYLVNWHMLRSMVWSIGLFSSVAIVFLCFNSI